MPETAFFLFVYDTYFEIVALLGPLVYLSATFIFAQILLSLCDHFCLCSCAPYGMLSLFKLTIEQQ